MNHTYTDAQIANAASNIQFIPLINIGKAVGPLGYDPFKLPKPLKQNLLRRYIADGIVERSSELQALLNPQGAIEAAFGSESTAPRTQQAELANSIAQAIASSMSGFDSSKVEAQAKAIVNNAEESILNLCNTAREQIEASILMADNAARKVQSEADAVHAIAAQLGASIEKDVQEAIRNALPVRHDWVTPKGVVVQMQGQHKLFDKLRRLVVTRENVWLPGPSGSGKSTAAEKLAESLGLAFYFNGRVVSDHLLTGYQDAHGNYQRTAFRDAFEHGGLYLADELDSWSADATLVLNMALSNGRMRFPDKEVTRHADFYCIGATNTWGTGATHAYIGRNRLDGAFMDRFPVTLFWDYDADLEIRISGNADWAAKVIAYRTKAMAKGLQVIISPRASIAGAKLLADGFSVPEVAEMCIKKGMTQEQWNSIQ